jgi:hypothetical protein
MVLTTASTATASQRSVLLLPPTSPRIHAACSWLLVSWSRTTVCASTPLMKMGSGMRPSASTCLCRG